MFFTRRNAELRWKSLLSDIGDQCWHYVSISEMTPFFVVTLGTKRGQTEDLRTLLIPPGEFFDQVLLKLDKLYWTESLVLFYPGVESEKRIWTTAMVLEASVSASEEPELSDIYHLKLEHTEIYMHDGLVVDEPECDFKKLFSLI